MRYFIIFRYPIILLAILCTSCGTALPTVKPYRLDVQQGNVVTSKMLLQLRPGMTKSQVRFIMGTPLVQDSFHGNRWDYVYQMRENGKITEQRRVILDFENDLLKTVRGDVIPSGTDKSGVNSEADITAVRVVNPSAKPEEKSFMSKLKFWEKDESELAKEAAAAKIKAEADAAAAAKKSAPVPRENVKPAEDVKSPAEDVKSILVIPADVVPKDGSSSLETTTPVAGAPVTIAPVDEVSQTQEAVVREIIVQDPVPQEAIVKEVAVIQPSISPPPVVQPQIAQPPVVEPINNVVAPAKIDAAVTAAKEKFTDKKTEVVVNDPMPTPSVAVSYNPTSGMKFQKSLTLASENVELVKDPEANVPRAGNKTVPKPKDLPVEESKPGFFDRMLEKIGF